MPAASSKGMSVFSRKSNIEYFNWGGSIKETVELAWGSMSTKRVLYPKNANAAETLMEVVVFPTPPF
jgi:hypothetical protein